MGPLLPSRVLGIGAAGCFAAAAGSYLLIPEAALNSGGPVGEYLSAVSENRLLFSVLWGGQAVGALLAMGLIPTVRRLTDPSPEGWMTWLSALAYLGLAVMALDFARTLTYVPYEAQVWANVDAAVQQMVAGDFLHLALDQDFLKYGTVGGWLVGAGLVSRAVVRPAMSFTVLALIAGVGCLGLAVEDLLPGFVEPLSAGMAGIGVPMFFLSVARYGSAGGDDQVAA